MHVVHHCTHVDNEVCHAILLNRSIAHISIEWFLDSFCEIATLTLYPATAHHHLILHLRLTWFRHHFLHRIVWSAAVLGCSSAYVGVFVGSRYAIACDVVLSD